MWRAMAILVATVTLAGADVVKESDGVHWWPGRGRVGPERCGTADTRPGGHADGTFAYFFDAGPGCPMACDGTATTNGSGPGAWCVHQHGVWDCGICVGGCSGIGVPCTVDGQCCSGFCIEGACLQNCCVIDPCTNGGMCVVSGLICECVCPPGFCGALCQTPCTTTTTTTSTSTSSTTSTSTTVSTSTSTTGTGPTTTSTSSTTTTSTSTTTTTILPASLSILWSPSEPITFGDWGWGGGTQLNCNSWVPPVGITGLTSMSFYVDIFSAADCGVAIYNVNGTTRLFTSGAITGCASGIHTTTAGAINLTAGTEYQVCTCGTSGFSEYVSATAGPSNGLRNIQNAMPTPLSTKGANACVAGAPPLTTGALSADLHDPILLLFGTNTP